MEFEPNARFTPPTRRDETVLLGRAGGVNWIQDELVFIGRYVCQRH